MLVRDGWDKHGSLDESPELGKGEVADIVAALVACDRDSRVGFVVVWWMTCISIKAATREEVSGASAATRPTRRRAQKVTRQMGVNVTHRGGRETCRLWKASSKPRVLSPIPSVAGEARDQTRALPCRADRADAAACCTESHGEERLRNIPTLTRNVTSFGKSPVSNTYCRTRSVV